MEEELVAVEITESCMVTPNEETPNHRLWLSKFDLLAPKTHASAIYLYKSNGQDPNFFRVDTLKQALSKALVIFYPLAGRLTVDDNGRPEVHCNGEGVFFSVARANCTMDEFGDFRPSPVLRRLLMPIVDNKDTQRSCILMLFQVPFLFHSPYRSIPITN